MVEITYQMVLSTIQTVSLVVGIIYYITIMRNQQRTRELALKAQEAAEKARQRDMIIQRSQTYGLDWMRAWNEINKMTDWESAEDFAEKYGGTESRAQWMYIARQYTLAGLHLKEGADPDLLFQLFPPYSIITLWERFEPVFRRQRDPNVWGPFEYLYTEVKKRYPDFTPG